MKNYAKAKKRIINNLDIIVSLFSILIILLLLSMLMWERSSISIHASYLFLLIPIFGSVIYLITRYSYQDSSFRFSSDLVFIRKGSLYKHRCILNILFFIFLICSAITILNRGQNYSRPTEFFIFISLAVGVLIIEIAYMNENMKQSSYVIFLIFKIIAIGIILRWSITHIFPGEIWYDPWFHRWFTDRMVEDGSLLALPGSYRPYDKLPMMHLLIGSVMIISNSSWKFASTISISFMSVVILSTFTFLIARNICNSEKIGLFASILAVSADMILLKSLVIYPNFLGLIFMLILVYLIFMKVNLTKGKNIRKTALVVMLMIVLILTHPAAGMSFSLILFALWLVPRIHSKIHIKKYLPSVSIFIVLFFLISMLAYWIYATGYIVELATLIKFGFALERYGGIPSEEATTYLLKTSSTQYMLNRMGDFIFYVFAFIGFLYFLAKGDRNNLALAFAGLAMVGFGGLGLIFELRNFQTRFLLASQFALAISAICGIVYVINKFRYEKIKLPLFTLVVTCIFFFMITSSQTNFDSPIYSENQVRIAYTQSEIQSMDTIQDIYNGTIITDEHTSVYFSYKNDYYIGTEIKKTEIIDDYIIKNDYRNTTGLILIREYIIHNPFKTKGGILKIDHNPRHELNEDKFSQVYDSGSVQCFLNTEREVTLKR